MKQNTYPDMGTRGFIPCFPKLLDGFFDGPFVEPLVSLELLGAWTNKASEVICADEAI
jgi:hypothetical protein